MKRCIILANLLLIAIIAILSSNPALLASSSDMIDFEEFNASSSGVVLTGQGGFYDDRAGTERLDFKVYTYADNNLGFIQNPTGGSQFIAGIQSGSDTWAVAKHHVDIDGGIWEIGFDFAVNFIGEVPGFGLDSYHAGGFWFRPTEPRSASFDVTIGWGPENEHGYYETEHVHVLYEASDESGSGFLGKPPDWIWKMPGETPGSDWENLPKNHWYRIFTKVDFETNKIISLVITDLETGSWTVIMPTDWYLEGGATGGLPPPSYFMLAAGIIWPSPSSPFPGGVGSVIAFDNIKIIRRPENPELTSTTHDKGQPSCDQILTIKWETPYAHGGVGGYSYTIVNQDDPYYNVNRTPDDTIDLNASATSFTTQPLETGYIWEFNIKTIDSKGVPALFYSSFWVEIDSCSVDITRPRNGDLFEVGEWINVFWEPVTYGGYDVGGGYFVDTIDLLKGPDSVINLVSNQANILSSGFTVPDVDPGSDYNLRIILERNSVGDMYPYLPEKLFGFSDYFSIGISPVVVDVVASDPSGHFSVTIEAGAEKGAPVTSWTEISKTNIASYTVTLSDGDMVMTIEGQLMDLSLEGQIILDVDPQSEIIRYEINIDPHKAPIPIFKIAFIVLLVLIVFISLVIFKLRRRPRKKGM